MTVKELKSMLDTFPDDLIVTVPQVYMLWRGEKCEGSETQQTPVQSIEMEKYWVPISRKNAKVQGYYKDCLAIKHGDSQ